MFLFTTQLQITFSRCHTTKSGFLRTSTLYPRSGNSKQLRFTLAREDAVLNVGYVDKHAEGPVIITAPGSTSKKFSGCGRAACALLETLALFKTKMSDFSYPMSDLTQNSMPYFRPAQEALQFA